MGNRNLPYRRPQEALQENLFLVFVCEFGKIHFSNGIVSEKGKEHRLAGTEGGDLYGAIFFPTGNYPVSKAFPNLLEKHGLRHIRFHDLRHSCASLLLKNGISMKAIQKWLGHSHFSTTANFYAHLDYDSKKDSANVVGGILMAKATGAEEKPQKAAPAAMTVRQHQAVEKAMPAQN